MKIFTKDNILKCFNMIMSFFIIILILFSVLGSKNRIGYLSEFNFIENIDNKYVYHFRLKYHSKVFKNSDIYGVYPNTDNIKDYIIKWDRYGSPFGVMISDEEIRYNENIDNIEYNLKIKPAVFILFFILAISYAVFIVNIKFNSFARRFDILPLYFLLISVFAIMFFSIKLYNFKMGLPLRYNYGDTIGAFLKFAMINNEGWFPVETIRLGAPFGSYFGVYLANLTMNADILMNKIVSLFVRDVVDAVSVSYFLVFPITSFISFYVMRVLKLSSFISILGSIVFSFIPFVFMRSIGHSALSTIYFIPISILLCLWLYSDDNILMPKKGFFRSRKNILSLIFLFMISNNGIGYYPFFTCFFICISAISKLLKTREKKYIIPFGISIFAIVSFFFINFIPLIIYKIKNNIVFTSKIIREFWEPEIYGLKISHLLLNPKIFGDKYYHRALLVNENITAYLGIIGIIGFFGLILYLLYKNYSKPLSYDFRSKLSLLSELNIFAVLLATIGGFSSIFSFFISSSLRSYNRISIYIAYISILALCIFIDNIIKKKSIIFYVASLIIFLFTLYDQIPSIGFYNKSESAMYIQDKNFIESIESVMPKGSAIYQLPTVPFADIFPPVKNIYHYYKLSIGYIFSKNLKWSYGGDYGREENEWYNKVNEMQAVDLLNEVSYAGFDGLYIDKNLFEDEEYINKVESELRNILDEKPIVSDGGNLLFFDLRNFKKNEIDLDYIPLINYYK